MSFSDVVYENKMSIWLMNLLNKIGFGLELATVLDQHISDVPHDGFLSAIYSTHPCNDDRVAALQNLGVPYSRY